MSFDPPVEPCTEIVGELHLQRLVGILEGSKLAEEVAHLSTSATLFSVIIFSRESNSYPFFLGNEDLSNNLAHRGKVYVQVSHLFNVIFLSLPQFLKGEKPTCPSNLR